MTNINYNIRREKKTIRTMMKMYCNYFHSKTDKLCKDCEELLEYAELRLDKCPLKENKPTCAECRIHCYKPDMLVKITNVMRYSGLRMVLKHPILAFFHLLNKILYRIKSFNKLHL